MEWVNSALIGDPTSPTRAHGDLPTLVVSQEQHDDFSPAPSSANKQSTITLTANKMTRAQLSHMDLASFNSKFGTLDMSGKGRGGLGLGANMRMLREESSFGLADAARDDMDDETF